MRVANRLPDFSVIVWLKGGERFDDLRSKLLSIAENPPDEASQLESMADFHWGFDNMRDARRLARAFKKIARRPEVVLLYIMSRVDDVASVTIKDERVVKH